MIQRTLCSLAVVALVGFIAAVGRADDDKIEKKQVKVESKKDAEKAEEKAKSAQIAHIRLHGDLEENAGSTDPLFGALTENFKQVLERIRKAQKDPNVQALMIQLDGLQIGWGKVDELRAALAEFRKSGKKIYSYVESGEAKDYIVASAGDRVVMPPSGWLMLVGTRAEITFYKELLERLGIRADFLQMGVFKFAAEPLTRNSMSKEARAQYEKVLGDYFENSYVGSIVRSRKGKTKGESLSADQVKKLIDEGPYTASKAAEAGLIDDVAYRRDILALIKNDLGAKEVKLLKNYAKDSLEDIDFSNPFSLLKLFAPTKLSGGSKKDRIAIIYAVGPITTGKGGTSLLGGRVVGSTTIIDAIRKAENDPKVRAIVLRVDSPGGSALASDLMWNELKHCKKPVIASMSDVAASGGYYISMPAKKIFAEPGTLTGSIGVVGGKLVLGGLFEKVGLHTETIAFGKNAGILSSSHTFLPSERKAMETLMEEVYDQFLAKAIEGRAGAGKTFTREQMLKVAEGRIWTGRQALDLGLVDALGTLDDAIAEAKVQGGLTRDTEVDYLMLPKGHTFFESLLEKDVSSSLQSQLLGTGRFPELGHVARDLDGLLQLRNEPVWLMMPHGVRMR